MDIKDKTVLITGASSGIGAAIAKAMADAGSGPVLLLARNQERLLAVAEEIEERGGKGFCFVVDLADPEALDIVARRIETEFGVPEILVNNAGSGRWQFLQDSDPQDIAASMAVPYFAAAWMTRRLLPGMLERGNGQIVNIGSVASRLAWPGATSFIAAGRAMRGLSDALGADLKGSGIRVTHYESGPVDTPYWVNNPHSRERVPGIARLLLPVLTKEQVAQAVVSGVQHNRRHVVVPGMLKLVYLLHFAVPGIVQWLMTRTGYRRPESIESSTN